MEYAKQMQMTIKLLASSRRSGECLSAIVAPCLLENTHPLFGVNGVFNAILYMEMYLGMRCFMEVARENFDRECSCGRCCGGSKKSEPQCYDHVEE